MNILSNILPSLTHLGVWCYWLVFFAAFFESMVFAGFVVPGSMLVVLVGFLSSKGYFNIVDLVWFATVGAILGDGVSYYLGTKGTGFFHNENRWLKAGHLESGKQFFRKHGSKSIFLGRFIAPLRAIVPFVAGLFGMKKGRFLFWNVISAFLWSTSHLLLGYFFGNALNVIEIWSIRVSYVIGGIIVIIAMVKYGKRIIRFMRSVSVSVANSISSDSD